MIVFLFWFIIQDTFIINISTGNELRSYYIIPDYKKHFVYAGTSYENFADV